MNKQNIGILRLGDFGNLKKIYRCLEALKSNPLIIDSEYKINKVDKIVLPGVGNFSAALKSIKDKDLLVEAIKKKHTLGICLGMQILATLGYEGGLSNGLNLMPGEVKPIILNNKVPHMGFNTLLIRSNSRILHGLSNEDLFYFMHSYEFVNYENVIALTNYDSHQFVSVVEKENIYGVQFHPENSREAGIKVFKNFINL